MSNENGTVKVITTDKQEGYVLNGDMRCIGDAIGKFFGTTDIFGTNSVSLNGVAISSDDMEKDLRPNDTILVLASNLASGGVKGA